MSDEKNTDGGPAFPIVEAGISLRDWFAGQAMASLLSLEDLHENYGESEIAVWAYQQADAMLAVRSRSA